MHEFRRIHAWLRGCRADEFVFRPHDARAQSSRRAHGSRATATMPRRRLHDCHTQARASKHHNAALTALARWSKSDSRPPRESSAYRTALFQIREDLIALIARPAWRRDALEANCVAVAAGMSPAKRGRTARDVTIAFNVAFQQLHFRATGARFGGGLWTYFCDRRFRAPIRFTGGVVGGSPSMNWRCKGSSS
jgi:hypothetical protein